MFAGSFSGDFYPHAAISRYSLGLLMIKGTELVLMPFNSFKKDKARKHSSSFWLAPLKPPMNQLQAKVGFSQRMTRSPRIGFKIPKQQKSMAAADPSLLYKPVSL